MSGKSRIMSERFVAPFERLFLVKLVETLEKKILFYFIRNC